MCRCSLRFVCGKPVWDSPQLMLTELRKNSRRLDPNGRGFQRFMVSALSRDGSGQGPHSAQKHDMRCSCCCADSCVGVAVSKLASGKACLQNSCTKAHEEHHDDLHRKAGLALLSKLGGLYLLMTVHTRECLSVCVSVCVCVCLT